MVVPAKQHTIIHSANNLSEKEDTKVSVGIDSYHAIQAYMHLESSPLLTKLMSTHSYT